MPKKIEIGIDEFTLVAQGNRSKISVLAEWESYANHICEEIAENGRLADLLGPMTKLDKLPQGYQNGFTFGDNPFYIALAFHPDYFQMGVILKFSAYAWSEYKKRWLKQTGTEMTLVTFLRLLPQNDFTIRLSRVDFDIDYFNYPMSVDDLYHAINDTEAKSVNVITYQGRQNTSKLSAVIKDGTVSTFYLGSKKANVHSLLRVYDKRLEQLTKVGIYYQRAANVNAWVRFEAVFKGIYAHQLTDILLDSIQSKDELIQLIIDKVTEKYSFWNLYTHKPITFTADLLKLGNGYFPPLSAKSPRDNDLARSVSYLRNGSGLYPIFYKIQKIWGNDALSQFIEIIIEDYTANYEPNKDTKIWLNKHLDLMKYTQLADLFLKIW